MYEQEHTRDERDLARLFGGQVDALVDEGWGERTAVEYVADSLARAWMIEHGVAYSVDPDTGRTL